MIITNWWYCYRSDRWRGVRKKSE